MGFRGKICLETKLDELRKDFQKTLLQTLHPSYHDYLCLYSASGVKDDTIYSFNVSTVRFPCRISAHNTLSVIKVSSCL